MSESNLLDELKRYIEKQEERHPYAVAYNAMNKISYLRKAVRLIEDHEVKEMCREYLLDISATISAQAEKIERR